MLTNTLMIVLSIVVGATTGGTAANIILNRKGR